MQHISISIHKKREIGHEYVTSSPVFNLHAISAAFLHNRPSSLSHATNFPPFSLFQGYWVFFLLEGNGPLSSVYKALQVIDFYLSFILPCHPIFGVDVSVKASRFSVLLESHVTALNLVFSCCFPCLSPFAFAGQSVVLMREVVNTEQNHWIVQGTAGMAVAICVIMVESQPGRSKYLRLPKNVHVLEGPELTVPLFPLTNLGCRSSTCCLNGVTGPAGGHRGQCCRTWVIGASL